MQAIIIKDQSLKRIDRIAITVTPPMKRALMRLAYAHRLTLTDLIFKSVLSYVDQQYPDEFVRNYEREFAKTNN